jgi:hypothetical protein
MPLCLYRGSENSAMNSSLRWSSVLMLLPLWFELFSPEDDEGSDLIVTPILLVADVDIAPAARRFTDGAPIVDDDGRFGGILIDI